VELEAEGAKALRDARRVAERMWSVRDVRSLVSLTRSVAPSFATYAEGGRVLAALAAREGVDVSRPGSLVNDVLIAASCREAGARLVTENVGDYAAVQRHLRGFRFVVADEVVG